VPGSISFLDRALYSVIPALGPLKFDTRSSFPIQQTTAFLASKLMSGEKRACADPSISATNPKRRYSEEQEELKCSICLDLVIDAVQVICCGTLYCRACICKCATCPLCRKAFSIIPDVRCERLSAAALRQCSWCSFKGNRASVADHEARECHLVPVGVLRKKNADLEEAFRKQHVMQRALMLCALGPEPASQAMRALHNIDADRGIFVIDRAASAGNAHWVCSWFAIADNHKMKPKEFLDLEMFRQILQGQEGHQVDATNHRCFTCGTYGHWAHDCIVSMSQGLHNVPINQRLFNAGCCSNCGMPVKAADLNEPDIQELQVCRCFFCFEVASFQF